MKITYWLACSLVLVGLATQSPGQSVNTPAGLAQDPPTSNSLILSNVTGEVRLLDTQGLVLETNFTFTPRIKLAGLSSDELRALLETKTAYAALTAFPSLYGTNSLAAPLESQLQQVWHQGNSLADKIQTRLEILQDLREYNNTLALLPGSMAAADQYEFHADAVNDWVSNRVTDPAEDWPEYSGDRTARHEAWERWERANNRAATANGQVVVAEQQVEGYLDQCARLSAHLASHGIIVPAAPPFTFIPPLTLKTEVDEERSKGTKS